MPPTSFASVGHGAGDGGWTLTLDRRGFLRLVAASGLAVAGSAVLPGLATGQAGDLETAAPGAVTGVFDVAAMFGW